MESIILKIVAVICVAIVAGIMAWKDKEGMACGTLLVGLAIIFISWDEVLKMII